MKLAAQDGEKMSYHFSFFKLNGASTRSNIYFNASDIWSKFILMHRISGAKLSDMLMLLCGWHVCVPSKGANKAFPYKAL